MKVKSLSHVPLLVTPWTAAHQAPPSMGFSRQEYWSGVPCLLSKRMGCLSGCLVSSASIQKLFCGSCSAVKGSLDEFVGEKVVSPSYSSTILGPPSLSLNLSTFLSLSLSLSLSSPFVYPQCPRHFLSDLLLLLLLSRISRVRLCVTP